MNNTEIEMILQEVLKEVQSLKPALLPPKTPSDENTGKISGLLQAIHDDLESMGRDIGHLLRQQEAGVPKIDFSSVLQFNWQLEVWKTLLQTPPPPQKVVHQHSFKDWQWAIVLILFIGSSLVLGWYALDNYYRYRDLTIKYNFIRKDMPQYTKLLDSVYQVNPDWVEKYNKAYSNAEFKKNRDRKNKYILSNNVKKGNYSR